jgi:hypothetical protein
MSVSEHTHGRLSIETVPGGTSGSKLVANRGEDRVYLTTRPTAVHTQTPLSILAEVIRKGNAGVLTLRGGRTRCAVRGKATSGTTAESKSKRAGVPFMKARTDREVSRARLSGKKRSKDERSLESAT